MTPPYGALRLAAKGYPVFPCNFEKKPTTPHGFKDASCDVAEITRLWRLHPGPLIGMPTGEVSGIDVLDNDPRHGGNDWVCEFATHLPNTLTVQILLHHTPKADDSTPRGHGSLNGDADVVMRLAKDAETGVVTASFTKNRNGPSYGVQFAFTISSETIGEDEDGDEITAPLAVECSTPASNASKLKPTEHTAKQFLADLLAEQGKPLPYGAGFAIDLSGVGEAVWREACDNRRLSTCEDKKERSKVFKRAYAGLREKGIIGTNAGWVWLTHPGRGIGDHP